MEKEMHNKMTGRYSVRYCSIVFPGVGYVDGIRLGTVVIDDDMTVHLKGFTLGEETTFTSFNEEIEFRTSTIFGSSIDVNNVIWHTRGVKEWKAGKCRGNNIVIFDDNYLEMILHGLKTIGGHDVG